MKRILALILAFSIALCGALTAAAEGQDAGAQPPEKPEGGFPGVMPTQSTKMARPIPEMAPKARLP